MNHSKKLIKFSATILGCLTLLSGALSIVSSTLSKESSLNDLHSSYLVVQENSNSSSSSLKTILKENEDKLHYQKQLPFVKDSLNPLIVKSLQNKQDTSIVYFEEETNSYQTYSQAINVLSKFNKYDTNLLSGRLPNNYNEISVSEDLMKFVDSNNKFHLNNKYLRRLVYSDPITVLGTSGDTMFTVVGTCKGTNNIIFDETLYQNTLINVDSNDVDSKNNLTYYFPSEEATVSLKYNVNTSVQLTNTSFKVNYNDTMDELYSFNTLEQVLADSEIILNSQDFDTIYSGAIRNEPNFVYAGKDDGSSGLATLLGYPSVTITNKTDDLSVLYQDETVSTHIASYRKDDIKRSQATFNVSYKLLNSFIFEAQNKNVLTYSSYKDLMSDMKLLQSFGLTVLRPTLDNTSSVRNDSTTNINNYVFTTITSSLFLVFNILLLVSVILLVKFNSSSNNESVEKTDTSSNESETEINNTAESSKSKTLTKKSYLTKVTVSLIQLLLASIILMVFISCVSINTLSLGFYVSNICLLSLSLAVSCGISFLVLLQLFLKRDKKS